MHEKERHRLILAAVEARPVVTVRDAVELTAASEATIRRDIAALHLSKRLRRVRGGAEALVPPTQHELIGRPFAVSQTMHAPEKRAIGQAAAALCADGDSIILNGGTTTFQMANFLSGQRCQVLTNSFPIAEHLLRHSRNTVTITGGTIYRDLSIVLSPYPEDVTRRFYARRLFMGAEGVGPLGCMESDPLLVQAEQKLIDQAEEIVILADSSKFARRASLISCPLARIGAIITDNGIDARSADMIRVAGIRLIVTAAETTALTG